MLRNMVTSLIKHERIRTTTPKAKTLRPYAERLVTYAKKSDQRYTQRKKAPENPLPNTRHPTV